MPGDPVRLRTVMLARALGVTTEEARTVVDVLDTVATALRRAGWIRPPAATPPRRHRPPPREAQLSGSLFPPDPLSPSPIERGLDPLSGSGSLVDLDLTRAGAKPNPCRAGRKTPWPEHCELTESLAAYATRQGLDARYQWGKFRAHALRDDVRHVNWVRAWEYWVRNAWEIQQRHA